MKHPQKLALAGLDGVIFRPLLDYFHTAFFISADIAN